MQEHLDHQTILCVDLDGTLVNTDTLVESALLLIKLNPLYLVAMVFWLVGGKANLKEKIANRVSLDVTTLPYNQILLEWLQKQLGLGRELCLVTAANQRIAHAVADHLGIFSRVVASSASNNLSARHKRDELARLFGEGGFDYAGNSRDDLVVWSICRNAVVVNAGVAVASRAEKIANVEAVFPRTSSEARALVIAMRPYQWSKNLLVFVSILIAHRYNEFELLSSTIIAFLAFCLCSSAVYLINDLLDLGADRKHREKSRRPFASGQASLLYGILAIPLLLSMAAVLAILAGTFFTAVLLIYFIITLLYSFYFKRVVLLDVLLLSLLYTLRILAGAAVAGELPSVWLVSFCSCSPASRWPSATQS